MKTKVMVVAGEASGDMHAANFVRATQEINPGIHFYGMGSTQMQNAGVELLIDCSDIAVVGLIEVLAKYRTIIRALNQLKDSITQNPPDLLVLVDYQEFNFKLAAFAKEKGVKVLFYISPQVWAWRQHRVHKIGKIIDMMAVILPFEEKFYHDANVPVRFVGNPLVDEARADKDKDDCLEEYGLDSSRPVVGLFPGSRKGEIRRVLPTQLAAAELLHKQKPQLQFILPVAHTLNRDEFTACMQKYSHLDVTLVQDKPYNVMQCCNAIITASGTATLEIALMGIPNCITYKIAPLSYWILKRMVKIDDIGLVNIVAEKRIVQEFIQHDAQPDIIATEINRILDDDNYRETMIVEMKKVRDKLGKSGGSRNLAELALELLSE